MNGPFRSLSATAAAIVAALAAMPDHPHSDHRATLRAALNALSGADGAKHYARQRQLDGDETEEAVLAQDAVGAALQALAALDAELPSS